MHIDGSSPVCSAKCTNVAYISASVNIVKISILIVSKQRHSSWNMSRAAALNALDVLKLCYNSEWEPLQMIQRMRQGSKRIIQYIYIYRSSPWLCTLQNQTERPFKGHCRCFELISWLECGTRCLQYWTFSQYSNFLRYWIWGFH